MRDLFLDNAGWIAIGWMLLTILAMVVCAFSGVSVSPWAPVLLGVEFLGPLIVLIAVLLLS